ncbi:M50 family metallopeptidase [Clostridium sp. CF011]|uniref:M50 family metallopeptidase n=3 Tax=Clostridium TaxID=1485 RepID=UPI00227D0FA8|nr:M50 family metallopeptidase [Clostridium sp. CF011]WAG68384.1 M50 family metallopeptidase [Clostridium sp. CF011]
MKGAYKTNLYNIVLGKVNLKNDYMLNRMVMYFIVGILIYFVSIFMHELGHYLMSKLVCIKLKLFVVGPIIYMNDKKRKIFRFRLSGPLISGGFILPEINDEINDKKSLLSYTNQYIKILYGGPIFTFVIILISSLFIIENKFTVICMILLIVNWSIFITIFYSSISVYGDYCLIDLLKRKPEFVILMFSIQFSSEYPINNFIVEESELFVDKILSKCEYNNMVVALINRIIDQKIINGENLSIQCIKFKEWIFNYYFKSSKGNIMFDAKIIKVAYKFLLHEYSLTKYELKLDNYKSFDKFLTLNNYNTFKYFAMINESLRGLFSDGTGFDKKYKEYICDAGQILSKCSNYKNLLEDIMKKLGGCEKSL